MGGRDRCVCHTRALSGTPQEELRRAWLTQRFQGRDQAKVLRGGGVAARKLSLPSGDEGHPVTGALPELRSRREAAHRSFLRKRK